MLGVPGSIDSHASYVESWVKALRSDKREIFRAAKDAQRMADYLTGHLPELQPNEKQRPDSTTVTPSVSMAFKPPPIEVPMPSTSSASMPPAVTALLARARNASKPYGSTVRVNGPVPIAELLGNAPSP